jgi:hypothetical protein
LVDALLAGACAACVLTAVSDDRYQSISTRNAFALREPVVPPVTPPTQTPAPAPKVIVTGLTDVGGVRKALLEITEAGKPVARAILSEGEAMGEVCVLRIDMPANRVKLRVQGTDSFLTLEIGKAPASPAPPTPPGKPSVPPPWPVRG